ncbi:MAG: hypothetical protein Q8O70_11335, partial [Burkholderiales bacterium]|nr:hypothetical protein [Burkholderiales bacterium]
DGAPGRGGFGFAFRFVGGLLRHVLSLKTPKESQTIISHRKGAKNAKWFQKTLLPFFATFASLR